KGPRTGSQDKPRRASKDDLRVQRARSGREWLTSKSDQVPVGEAAEKLMPSKPPGGVEPPAGKPGAAPGRTSTPPAVEPRHRSNPVSINPRARAAGRPAGTSASAATP